MLHILWLVIKFILIVLGIILGLVLLAAVLLLFCPVRYQAAASKEGVEWKLAKAKGAVSWLFGGIAFWGWYEESGMHTSIRIFGIPIDKFLKKKMHKSSSAAKPKAKAKEESIASGEPQKEPEIPELEISEPEIPEPEIPELEISEPEIPEPEIPESEIHEPVQDIETETPQAASIPSQSGEQEIPPQKPGTGELIHKVWEKLKQIFTAPVRILRSLAVIPGRIVQKIRKIALTFRGIYDKIDWWKQFVNHPRTQEAISLVWNHAKGLIRHILPTKIEGKVTFGSEDPAVTGTVLAVLGMSFPLHKNRIAVNPLFDGENVLEGNVRLKGRIYGWVLLKAAVTIYFNKNVKYVINRWKHKEG